MDSPGMAPSSYPDPDPFEWSDFYLLHGITALIVVGVVVLSLLHVLGSLRRASSHKLLHALVLGAYTLSYSLVAYTLGLMQHSNWYYDVFPVWAVCLFMLLGGTDSLMACGLRDIDNWKSFYVKHLIKGGLVVYIVAKFRTRKGEPKLGYEPLLWAILFVNVLQSYARINSMRRASKSQLLRKNVKPIADYMRLHEDQRRASDNEPDPKKMEGYRYIVAGEHTKKNSVEMDHVKITTVEQIWQCEGSLLQSKRGSWLKDVCLSMALSKMLNRRFVCLELTEAVLQKTHDFVFKGLLSRDSSYERAFRVIEVELSFVYDLYYTRYPYLYQKGRYFGLLLPTAMVTLCSCLTYQLRGNFKKNKENTPMGATMFLMAMVTLLEVFQLYLHVASGWFKVALIRSYVTSPALQSCRCFSQTIIALLLRLKSPRPWERKLGQYSLLHSFNSKRLKSNFIHFATLCLVDKAKKGCKREKLVKLSIEVKKAVIGSLTQSKGHLTNGMRSLQENGVHEKLSWACEAINGMTTHTILVWHIATTYCRHKLDAEAKNKQLPALSEEDRSAANTASHLSQYCAYLVAFAPDLLPDHSFDSASVLDETIEEARRELSGGKMTMESKCEKLMSISAAGRGGGTTTVVMGARLARTLSEDIQDPSQRWKILSEFWAEMILYLAPCKDDRARAHLEALARGGEFITHLWALLTHAGIVDRPTEPLSAV